MSYRRNKRRRTAITSYIDLGSLNVFGRRATTYADVAQTGTPAAKPAQRADVFGAFGQVPLHRTLNTNAGLTAREYGQPHERTLWQYERTLGFRASALRPGDVFIDSGGGTGIAGLSFALGHGVRAKVLNTQDFFGPLLEAMRAIQRGDAGTVRLDATGTALASIGGVAPKKLASIAKAAGVDGNAFTRGYANAAQATNEITAAARRLAPKLIDGVESGRFEYALGYAEELLPNYAGQAKLITDYWGAFAYSPDRHKLLEQYYSALQAGGEARILVGEKTTSEVRTKTGSIELVDYLARKYPTIFSVKPCLVREQHPNARILIMRKDPQIARLELPLDRLEAKPRPGHFSTPELVFAER